MKKTLIALSLILAYLAVSASEVQKKYNVDKETGVITLELVEVEVIEKLSFENTTDYSFLEEELDILFQGGEITRRYMYANSLFPPMFSEVTELVSISDGSLKVVLHPSKPEEKWLYFIFFVLLPCVIIIIIGIAVPKNQRSALIAFYGASIISAFLHIYSDNVFANLGTVFIIFALLFLGSYFGSPLALGMSLLNIILIGSSVISVTKGNENIATAYISTVILSCVVSYIIRQVKFRKKEINPSDA